MRTILATLLLCGCTSMRYQMPDEEAWGGRPAIPLPGKPDAAHGAMPTPIAPADAMPPAPKPDATPTKPVDAAPPPVDAAKPPDAAKPDAAEPVDATPEPPKPPADGGTRSSTRMSVPGECPDQVTLSCISGHCWSRVGGSYTIYESHGGCSADGTCRPMSYLMMDGSSVQWQRGCRIGACVLICE